MARPLVFLALLLGVAPLARADAPTPAPVTLDGQVAFTVRAGVASFTPADRAKLVQERLQRLARDGRFDPAALRLSPGDATLDVVAGDQVVVSVTDADARAAGRTREALAAEDLAGIRAALQSHREARSTRSLLLGGLYALLATTGLVLLIWLVSKLLGLFCARVDAWAATARRGLRIQSFELLSAQRAGEIVIEVVRWTRLAVIVFLLYGYLPTVLSFFPWTRGWAETLFGWVLGPLGAMASALVGYLPRLMFIVVAVVIARQVNAFVRAIFREIERGNLRPRGFYREWARPTAQLASGLIVVFTAVVVFPYLPGAQSSAFQNISIFVGVLVSLGSSSAVANTVAGVILTYTRAFKVGDWVQIGDAMGDVIEKTLLVTRIRTPKNVEISIPNSMVLGSHVSNFSSHKGGLTLHTEVTIGYDVPWRKVHELLREAARQTEGLQEKPAPYVLQRALNDFYVTYELNVQTTHPAKMLELYSELHQRIQDAFFAAGVEIMSPHFTSVRDGNRAAIPAEKLPRGYRAPGFRVEAAGLAPPPDRDEEPGAA